MKPKPLRQKQGKTFTFQPFSERITHLNIDIFHRVGHKNEEVDNERETFFYQTIVKWNGLNTSESYNELCKELTHHVKILPQIIAQKDKLINTLIKYLQLKNEFSLEPTLEFIVSLAKDLTHQEFYEYFPRIFPLIINLLYCKDYDQIEWAFQCLAYLFKILWKQLVQDIDNVLHLLLPLLNSSQPLYIVNFSAQSFAYVARKIKNRKQFIHLILKALRKQPEGEDGCGTLLFETIKGVSGKLHSCTQGFLTDVVGCLGEPNIDTQCLARVLSSTLNLLISELEPDQSAIVWTILHKKLSEFLSAWQKDKSDHWEQSILNILGLMKVMAVYKRGITVAQPKPIIDVVIQMVQDPSLSDPVLQEVVIIAAALQRSPGVKISQEFACQLAYNVLRIPQRHLYLDFIERVFSCAGFYTLVLPSLLNFCESASPDSDLLEVLTKLVLHKVPSIALGSHFDEWKRIPLDFTNKKKNNLLSHMTSVLNSSAPSTDDILCTILIAPHVNAPPHLLSKFHEALNKLRSHDVSSDTQRYMYTLLVETQLRIDPTQIDLDTILNVLKSSLNEVCALRTVDLCLSVLEVDVKNLDQSLTSELKKLCVNNLCSPYAQIRTLSSHILTRLEPLHSELEATVFNLIHEAETTETTLQSYRDKLSLLQKLETYPCLASLKYMFGVLYVNFSLLWKPVCSNIVALADTMPVGEFWPEYVNMLGQLKQTENHEYPSIDSKLAFLIEHHSLLTSLTDKPDHGNVRVLLWETLTQMKKLIGLKNRDLAALFLDFVNEEFSRGDAEVARVWNIRSHEGEEKIEEEDESEEENDDSETEEKPQVENKKNKKRKLKAKKDDSKQSYKKLRSSLNNDTSEEEPTDKQVDMETSYTSLNGSKVSLNTSRVSLNSSTASAGANNKFKMKRSRDAYNKNSMRLFLAHFNVMAVMPNPKSVHREPEIRKIYEEFLCHRNSIIQKVCLDCILNYKIKDAEPYRESLYALVDDKTFRNHLTMFAISPEDDQDASGKDAGNSAGTGRLKEEHRPVVMKIVLRIVYGKMLGGAGAKAGSKSSGSVRRAMILRFLAGCKAEEFDIFLDMAFKLILPFINIESPLSMVQYIKDTVDLEQVIPPKRLLSLMNLADIVLSHCGSLAMDKLLRIILCVGSYVGSILSQRSLVHSGYLNILGKVKTAAILSLNEFFERYSEFQYSSDIVDAMFETFVWPGLEKLNSEGVYSPTALTKLFIVWSKEPKYFPLLVKYAPEMPSSCPLASLVQLLLNDRTHISVRTVLLDVIENLVTLEDDGDSDNVCVTNSVVKKSGEYKSLNYGSFLLKPYVLSILKYYQTKLKRSKKQDVLQARDLTIISRITELVSDEKTSTALIHVLIPLVISKVRSGEAVISPLLTTLLNLMRNVTSSQANQFLRSLGVLFLTLTDSGARTLLLDMTAVLAAKIKDEDIDISLLKDLTAMNSKFVEQPDFDRRLDAFNRVQKLVNGDQEISPIQGVLIVYTAMHYLQYEKDISMRTSSSYCLQKLCPHLCRLYQHDAKNKDYIVQNTILSLIRNNLQCKKTDFKEDSIMLLGYMVRECPPSLHPVLTDLHQFSCAADLETDLFENVLHVQLHRRSRAMLRFVEQCKTLFRPLNARTITQYIVPMFSQFLLSEKYLDKNTLLDAAIGALSTCARLLRWREYETLLTGYLGKLKSCGLTLQKQLIKILSSLLDAFHFDLSRAYEGAVKTELELPPVIDEKTDADKDDTSTNQEKDEEGVDDNTSDNEDDLEEEDDESEPNNNTSPSILLSKPLVLSKTKASRVIFSIHRDILPGLYKILVMKAQGDSVHKVNRKSLGPDRDEEDLMKIPVALAIVKLLQKLPVHLLERNLPSLFTKLCTFCRCKLESVRKLTRETLQKIMATLGARYLGLLTREMQTLLARGFQAHVLAFTLHAVLVSLRTSFTRGDLDHCTLELIEVFSEDLFGETAEEKDVAKIQSKVAEARSQKSYDAFCILAQYVSEKYLLNLVMPAKEVLSSSLSHKLIFKASECLRHIALGLADNKFVTLPSQLTFAYGVVSQSIAALAPPVKEENKSKLLIPERPDCYIIPKEPRKRLSAEKKTAAVTNANIIVEFGLRLYQVILKRDRLKRESEQVKAHLDPVVPLMAKCLTSQHVKLNTLSIQCLTCIMKMNLSSMKQCLKEVTANVFALLHKYAAQGMGKGDNYELVLAAFKYVGTLLRDVRDFTFLPEQLTTLLLYVEQDLHDPTRQASGFLVLKAILHRKLTCGDLASVMQGVAKLAITSYHINVRVQANQAYITYLYEYPLDPPVLESHLSFILSQLDYEILEGRDCALDMIQSILDTFPKAFIADNCELLFISLGARLINETQPELRKKIAALVRSLVTAVDGNHGEKLLDIAITWMRDEKVAHKRLGSQLCGIFLEAENLKLVDRHLTTIMSALRCQFVKHSVRVPGVEEDDDHHVYQALVSVLKLITRYPAVLSEGKHADFAQDIGEHCQRLLGHEHVWIRLAACQILFKLFSSISPATLAARANQDQSEVSASSDHASDESDQSEDSDSSSHQAVSQSRKRVSKKPAVSHMDQSKEDTGFLAVETRSKLRSLVLDHVDQLGPDQLEDLMSQVMKNLVYLAQVVKDVELREDKMSLRWIVKILRRRCHEEIVHAPLSFTVRKMCFNWLAALAVKLSREELESIALSALAPLVREMGTTEEKFAEIRQVAVEAANYYKKRLGSEIYLKTMATLQQRQDVRRAMRKKERAQGLIKDPETAAKRKINKQLKRKESKKRKMELIKKKYKNK